MIRYYRRFLFLALFILSACHGNGDGVTVRVTSDFESGSIGQVRIISDSELELSLADDNNNPELPKRWRNWWYVRLDNLPLMQPVLIRLKNRGWPYYYLPVYSYDQKTWHHFKRRGGPAGIGRRSHHGEAV